MKRILVVTEAFFPETFLINDLVKQWQKDGHKVDVLTQWPSYPAGRIYPGYKNKYYVKEQWGMSVIHRFKLIEGYRESKIKKILNYAMFVWLGTKIARKIGGNYDHVFVHQTGPLTLALPAVAIKKKFGIPVTIWTFDIWPDAVYAYGFPHVKPLEWLVNKIVRKVYSHSDNILVSSRKFADTIKQYAPDKNIVYVPNWYVPGVVEQSRLRLDGSKFNFTFAGNISISQNLENVVRGFSCANLHNAVLNIVGNGSKFETLKELVEKENIKNVVLHGSYPYNQIADILSQSDMLVLPLIADTGIEKTEPLKLQAYLVSGKPILGICRGACREIILEEKVGVCAEPDNIEDIAVKFCQSIEFAETEQETVRVNACRLLQTRFNKEQIINKIDVTAGFK